MKKGGWTLEMSLSRNKPLVVQKLHEEFYLQVLGLTTVMHLFLWSAAKALNSFILLLLSSLMIIFTGKEVYFSPNLIFEM